MIRCSFLTLTVAAVLAVAAVHSRADIVKLTDGRQFEGTVTVDTAEAVTIDTVVSTVRTMLSFKRSDVASVEKKALPNDFFNPRPAPRESEATRFGPDDNVYIDVPIIGTFGQQVYAQGIQAALAYAADNGIRNVVFTIDSDGNSGSNEVRETWRLLRRYEDRLKFHAVVRECVGDALILLMLSNTVHVEPGAKIGAGEIGRGGPADQEKPGEDELVIIRLQLARQAGEFMESRGRPGYIIRAMIDPREMVFAWRDSKGQLQYSKERPSSVPAEQLILADDSREKALVVTYDQAKTLGIPTLDGGAAKLGEALKLSNWKKESDYGAKAMQRVADQVHQAEKNKQLVYETKVKENISRRDYLNQALSYNLKEAAEWDPNKGDYATYGRVYDWDWGGGNYTSSNRWTRASQDNWAQRSTATISYLDAAYNCAVLIRQLDKEAGTLGLKPTFTAVEMDTMLDDLKVKRNFVELNRNRQGS